jgi:hypothetical protein
MINATLHREHSSHLPSRHERDDENTALEHCKQRVPGSHIISARRRIGRRPYFRFQDLHHSLDGIFHAGYILFVTWEIEYTDAFGRWWVELTEDEQVSLAASVGLLEERGPGLGFPHSSGISGSRHSHMRELRTQHQGRPLRTLYAFDPRRAAILLIGGDKTGDGQWYDRNVPIADRLYDEHLEQLRKEGQIDG